MGNRGRDTFSAKINAAGEDRLCLECTKKLVPDRSTWGSWFWGWGDCITCGHFGITTEGEYVRALHEYQAIDNQQELGL